MTKQSEFAICCDCGYVVKINEMFIKQYQNTEICLCKRCAEKLCNEIEEKFIIKKKYCNNKFRSLTDDEYAIYDNALKLMSKDTGLNLFQDEES